MQSTRSLHRVAAVLAVLALSFLLTVAAPSASFATEAEGEKVALPENPHDQVGLIILGVAGLGAAAAGLNAYKQLRGERPQADGKIRWR